MGISRNWKQRVLTTLLRVEQEWGVDLLPDSAPMWKAKVAEKLMSSASLASRGDLRSFADLTSPRKLGGFVGVKKACSDALFSQIRKRKAEVIKRGFTLRDRMLFEFFGATEMPLIFGPVWFS